MRHELQSRKETPAAVELFDYPFEPEPAMTAWATWEGIAEGQCPPPVPPPVTEESETPQVITEDDWKQRLEDEAHRSFEAGHQQGIEEGRAAEREVQEEANAKREGLRGEQICAFMQSFGEERAHYFETVEHEVVKLSLAVAARILRREAQTDPLLLTGAVRVALGQIAASTQVRLRVPSSEFDLWMDTMAHLPNLPVKPVVIAGEGMRVGECVVEADLGSVDLGVRAQLGEIERSFFNRKSSVSEPVKKPAADGSK